MASSTRRFGLRSGWRIAAVALILPTALEARTYTISTFADDSTVNGNCTLREALRAANTNGQVDACLAGELDDVIFLPNGNYPFFGAEVLTGGGSLAILGTTLNPFSTTIDLGGGSGFIAVQGGGSYTLGGVGISGGVAAGPFFFGGAIYANGASLRIYSSRFVSNSAAGSGGAIWYSASQAASQLRIDQSSFLSNSTPGTGTSLSSGGAVNIGLSGGARAELRDVSFVTNSVAESAFPTRGGALAVTTDSAATVARCIRCRFQNNSATTTSPSGGDEALGGAVYAQAFGGSRIELFDGHFTGNAAFDGGSGVSSAAILAESHGGSAIHLERLFVDLGSGAADPQTYDVVLRTYDASSSIHLLDSQLTFGAARGLSASAEGDIVLGHLTIADYPLLGASLIGIGGQIRLHNSIVTFNGSDLFTNGNVQQSANFVGGNPLFANEPAGDYHLTGASTAIGAGNNSSTAMSFADLDHHPRIVGATTDTGCYEFGGLFADDFEVSDAGSWSAMVQ